MAGCRMYEKRPRRIARNTGLVRTDHDRIAEYRELATQDLLDLARTGCLQVLTMIGLLRTGCLIQLTMMMVGCRMTEYRELATQDLLDLTIVYTMIG